MCLCVCVCVCACVRVCAGVCVCLMFLCNIWVVWHLDWHYYGVTLTPGYVAAVALLLAVRDLDNSIWKAGGSTGCARLLTGLNCSVSEPMGVPLTPPLQCVATVGRD